MPDHLRPDVTPDAMLLASALGRALTGAGAHVDPCAAFVALDWKLAGARPAGAPHSVYQLLNHMTFWHEWVVKWLDGERPRAPKQASGSWPAPVAPRSRAEWLQATRRFSHTVEELIAHARERDPLVKGSTKTRLEMLQTIAAHTSYHTGEVVLLRQLLGAWPPPSGGLTW